MYFGALFLGTADKSCNKQAERCNTINLPHVNLIIFPTSACPSSWFKRSKSIVVFHCSSLLPDLQSPVLESSLKCVLWRGPMEKLLDVTMCYIMFELQGSSKEQHTLRTLTRH